MEQRIGNRFGYTLEGFGAQSASLASLRKSEVRTGDWIVVRTRNSVYLLVASGEGRFIASGGWFTRKGKDGLRTGVTGCSLGGSIIKIDIIAACGLCMEFSNRLVTSPVRWFTVFPAGWVN